MWAIQAAKALLPVPVPPLSHSRRESRSAVRQPFSRSSSHSRPTKPSTWRAMSAVWAAGVAGETLHLRVGEKLLELLELGGVPGLERRLAGGLAVGPLVHVEPLDVAHRHRRRGHHLGFEQHGGDGAALLVQGDAQLVEADAGLAHRMLGEEAEREVGAFHPVEDAAAPVVAGLDGRIVFPDLVARGLEVALDTLDDGPVVVVAVAQEDLHGPRRTVLAFRNVGLKGRGENIARAKSEPLAVIFQRCES
ncbi:MAG: hypothetical protein NTV97_14650 [Alphaproteobacteria bacterium]|nr:hypothetical protein [Alphaproteobacteria bacterium]